MEEPTQREQPTKYYVGPAELPSAAAKAGYFALGLFLPVLGVCIAYLIAKDSGTRGKEIATGYALCGLASAVLLAIVWFLCIAGCLLSLSAY